MMIILIALFLIGWVAVAAIGTQAYFLGEQTKPIHEKNWNSDKFEKVAQSVTGKETNYSDRIPAYSMDAYASNSLSS
jgi:cytochrome b561